MMNWFTKWKLFAEAFRALAIIVFRFVVSRRRRLATKAEAKVLSLAHIHDQRGLLPPDWMPTMKTIEARTFSFLNGNNLNSRRDDVKLFPRVVLGSSRILLSEGGPWTVKLCLLPSLSPHSSSWSDLYRFEYTRKRGKKGGRMSRAREKSVVRK